MEAAPLDHSPEHPGRSENIIGAVSFASKRLAQAASWQEELPEVLQRLGDAAGVSRAYVYENSRDANGMLLMTEQFEWVARGIRPTINDPTNVNFPYHPDFARYEEILGEGGIIAGLTKDFPETERADMELEEILSTAFVPVFVDDEWWGYLGFDDCVSERNWTEPEIEALRSAADTLAAAITRQRQAERLRQGELKFSALVGLTHAVTYMDALDEKATTFYISPNIEQMLGYTDREWRIDSQLWFKRLHPDDRDRAWAEYMRGRESGEPWTVEMRMLNKDDRVVYVREEDVIVRDEHGGQLFVLGVMYDVSEEKRAADRYRDTEAKYQTLIEQLPAITYLDPLDEWQLSVYVSPQVTDILGCTPEEWLNNDTWWRSHLHPDDAQRTWDTYVQHRDSGEPLVQEYRMVRDDGRVVWIRETASILRDEKGNPWVIQGLMQDITDRKQAEEEIAFLAYHDKLTGLANRAMFEEMLEPALARARRNGHAVAVLYMDLDNFKLVNDSLGHEAGDELLKHVATRLLEATRETDVVARQGGDEFLVLLPDLEPNGEAGVPDGEDYAVRIAEMMAERIHDVMRAPFELGEVQVHSSASMGISVFPTDAVDARGLLKNADVAMYESKKAHPGGYSIHSETGDDPLTEHSYTTRLRKAVKDQHWVLQYQPAIELASSKMVGVEALLRWRRPRGGLIPPGEFLPMAEEMGLLEIIGEWVLEDLSRQSREWTDRGIDLSVSFNLSPRQLFHRDLADKVLRTLRAADVDPGRVIVEIAEATALADPVRTQRILWSLHERGVRLAIDDFGTGYSPPARLKHLPVDILKIDQPLTRDLPDDPDVSSFVQAVIEFAAELGMTPLAEGVETDEQRRFLIDKGCKQGQGYLFSRPVYADAIEHLYREGAGQIVPSL